MARRVKKFVSRILNKRRFELEALEPRCLLSGGAVAVVVSPLAAHALLAATEAQTQDDQGQSQSSAAYDPVAQVGSILPGGAKSPTAPASPSPAATPPAGNSASPTAAQNQIGRAHV